MYVHFLVVWSYPLNAEVFLLLTATDPEHTRVRNYPIDIPPPDEDVEELITDLDVQAEVTLAFKPSSFYFVSTFPHFLILCNRIQMATSDSSRQTRVAFISDYVATLSVQLAVSELFDSSCRSMPNHALIPFHADCISSFLLLVSLL